MAYNKTYAGGSAGPLTATPPPVASQSSWARGVTNTLTTYNNAGAVTVTYIGWNFLHLPILTIAWAGLPGPVQGPTPPRFAYNDPSELLSESYGGGRPLYRPCRHQRLRRLSAAHFLSPQLYHRPSISLTATMPPRGSKPSATVANNSATYSYLANSPLVGQIVLANSGTTRVTTAKQYDFLNRLTQMSSAPSGAPAIILVLLQLREPARPGRPGRRFALALHL